MNVFRLINTCESAKEAWDILETTYEGTDKVKNSRLQLVTTKFENMKMYEEETIREFYVRIRDLSNESHALGEPMSDAKLVKKILRSLPERFKIKVTTIDEVHDTSEMKVDELIGSLLIYKMSFTESSEKKHRGLALKTTSAEPESPKMEGSSESYDESLALMVKNYGKLMKRFERRSPNTSSQSNPSHNREKTPQNYKPGSFNKKGRDDRSNPFGAKAKGIQCIECEGFGHIQAECPNYLRRQQKNFNTTLSDDESVSGSDGGEEGGNNFLAFMTRNTESSDVTSEENIGNALAPSEGSNELKSASSEELSDEFLLHTYEVIMSQTEASNCSGSLREEAEEELSDES